MVDLLGVSGVGRVNLHEKYDHPRYKLIRQAKVTAANVDDGQTLTNVLDTSNTGKRLLADRGYDAQANRESSVIVACLQRASLARALRRTDTTSKFILAGVAPLMVLASCRVGIN
jgi:hypothetical protein